ncbi:RidA family protein [Streptomyces prunicolor]|uniref:RidA family protein n=1 Tax=Streptomyces prunicolor TaxID=67348 RepID=A0ABU4FE64_9ACTN|nr:RidA family protein [Streptomyces prunicolor]MCX5239864.1 RidA family protein [Streptomyces prunicolor]MDV7218877.1 RidA family protein [Streptomyces prunicolor]
MERINPPTLAPPVRNLYTQVLVSPPGRTVNIAGQVAIDKNGELVGPDDYREQARQAFLNVKLAIEAVGGTGHDITSYGVHVVRYNLEVLAPIYEAGKEVFGDEWPMCPSMLLGVEALGLPEWLIEINATAVLGDE